LRRRSVLRNISTVSNPLRVEKEVAAVPGMEKARNHIDLMVVGLRMLAV
jgi:hypothetical protein